MFRKASLSLSLSHKEARAIFHCGHHLVINFLYSVVDITNVKSNEETENHVVFFQLYIFMFHFARSLCAFFALLTVDGFLVAFRVNNGEIILTGRRAICSKMRTCTVAFEY